MPNLVDRFAGSVAVAIFLLTAAPAALAASPEEAARLGADLTPLGGEKAGNKDGTIPAWEGGDAPLDGWQWGKERSKFSRLKAEKPVFSIDATNADKYADRLSPAQLVALKNIKGKRLDVYPTHRTCAVTPLLAERTKINATEAKLSANGEELVHAKTAGIPFPIPKTAYEVMWNAKLRPQGIGFDLSNGVAVNGPTSPGADMVRFDYATTSWYPGGTKADANVEDVGIELTAYFVFKKPAGIAGTATININHLNKDAENYEYLPGRRRVQRLPSYSYDGRIAGFDNMYLIQEQLMIWMLFDRYAFNLVGKQEMYISNNDFAGYDFTAKQADALAEFGGAKPEYRRYELHRVWVVESNLKPGFKNMFPKRVFYIDEDSWNIVAIDNYGPEGGAPKRFQEVWQIPVWELGGVCSYAANQMINLPTGTYVVDYMSMDTEQDVHWYDQSDDQKFKSSFYTPENLRAMSDR
jgi:hypothetical protein